MAFPTAAGVPSLSGNYIPNLFAKKLLVYFYMTTVFNAIANTDYEGMIQNFGDSVKIRQLPELTISDYADDQNLVYEHLSPPTIDLLIDKGKSWAFKVGDIPQKQSDIKDYASRWGDHASRKLKESVDSLVLSDVYTDVHASNAGLAAGFKSGSYNLGVSGTPLQVTADNVIDLIADMGSVLDEQSVPDDARFLVIPAWFANLIKKSELKDASLSGDAVSMARNGRLGMIDRFTIYMSNQVDTTSSGGQTASEIVFGHKVALTFAAQINKSEKLRNPFTFGDLMRGLMVFGYQVVKPEAMGHLHAYK